MSSLSTENPKNNLATISMITGIISLVSFVIPGPLNLGPFGALFIGIIAVVLGLMAKNEIKKTPASNIRHATAGLVLGGLGIFIGVAAFLMLILIGPMIGDVFESINNELGQ
jgi:hypothetical protein